MSYINKEMFEMLANPAIIEQVDNDNNFDALVEIIDDTIYQLTKIEIPANPATTPKWLITHVLAIMSKYVINRLQNVSDELRNQVNNDYEKALEYLRGVKISDAVSTVVAMPNMLNADILSSSKNWSIYD